MSSTKSKIAYGVYYLWEDSISREKITREGADEWLRFAEDFASRDNVIGYDFLSRLKNLSPDEFVEQWNWLVEHEPSEYSDCIL